MSCLSDENPRAAAAEFGHLETVDDGSPEELWNDHAQRTERQQIGEIAGISTFSSKERHHGDGDETPRTP